MTTTTDDNNNPMAIELEDIGSFFIHMFFFL